MSRAQGRLSQVASKDFLAEIGDAAVSEVAVNFVVRPTAAVVVDAVFRIETFVKVVKAGHKAPVANGVIRHEISARCWRTLFNLSGAA